MDDIRPDLIFVGANTSDTILNEPTKDEALAFIEALFARYPVYVKENMKRLLGGDYVEMNDKCEELISTQFKPMEKGI